MLEDKTPELEGVAAGEADAIEDAAPTEVVDMAAPVDEVEAAAPAWPAPAAEVPAEAEVPAPPPAAIVPPPVQPVAPPPASVVPPPVAAATTVGPQVFCHACGSQIDGRAEICPRCGVRQHAAVVGTKSKVVAALLGIFLGNFGLHKFYLGKTAQGVIYLLFFWTFIPGIIGFFEGIIYHTKSDEEFARAYG
jgi:hypothetical protein